MTVDLYYLPIQHKWDAIDSFVNFLVLLEAATSSHGSSFYRIAIGVAADSAGSDLQNPQVLLEPQADQASYPCTEYLTDSAKHIVCLE